MELFVDGHAVSGYVKFVPAGEENKQTVWHIFIPGSESRVGEVRWLHRVNRYAFFPVPHVWFDCSGLRMIAEFCEKKTELKKIVVNG